MAKLENLLWVYLNITISMETMCLNYFVLHYVLTTNTTSYSGQRPSGKLGRFHTSFGGFGIRHFYY